jgi:SET domain-containing protein
MNHSDDPNMVAERHGERFVAKKPIKRGEELLVNYNTYDELIEDFRPRKRGR